MVAALILEGKVGVVDLDSEIKLVEEIRSALGPDAVLRLDANMPLDGQVQIRIWFCKAL